MGALLRRAECQETEKGACCAGCQRGSAETAEVRRAPERLPEPEPAKRLDPKRGGVERSGRVAMGGGEAGRSEPRAWAVRWRFAFMVTRAGVLGRCRYSRACWRARLPSSAAASLAAPSRRRPRSRGGGSPAWPSPCRCRTGQCSEWRGTSCRPVPVRSVCVVPRWRRWCGEVTGASVFVLCLTGYGGWYPCAEDGIATWPRSWQRNVWVQTHPGLHGPSPSSSSSSSSWTLVKVRGPKYWRRNRSRVARRRGPIPSRGPETSFLEFHGGMAKVACEKRNRFGRLWAPPAVHILQVIIWVRFHAPYSCFFHSIRNSTVPQGPTEKMVLLIPLGSLFIYETNSEVFDSAAAKQIVVLP